LGGGGRAEIVVGAPEAGCGAGGGWRFDATAPTEATPIVMRRWTDANFGDAIARWAFGDCGQTLPRRRRAVRPSPAGDALTVDALRRRPLPCDADMGGVRNLAPASSLELTGIGATSLTHETAMTVCCHDSPVVPGPR